MTTKLGLFEQLITKISEEIVIIDKDNKIT